MEPPRGVNVTSSSSAAPLLSLVIPPPMLTNQHEYYDLSQDIFISPPRSDRRGRETRDGSNDMSPVAPNFSSSSLPRPTGDAAAPADKGKKKPWRDRLLAVAASNGIGSSSSAASSSLSLSLSSSADHHHHGGGGSRSARSRIHLWSQSAASAKPVSPVDSPPDKRTRARLPYPDTLS